MEVRHVECEVQVYEYAELRLEYLTVRVVTLEEGAEARGGNRGD